MVFDHVDGIPIHLGRMLFMLFPCQLGINKYVEELGFADPLSLHVTLSLTDFMELWVTYIMYILCSIIQIIFIPGQGNILNPTHIDG